MCHCSAWLEALSGKFGFTFPSALARSAAIGPVQKAVFGIDRLFPNGRCAMTTETGRDVMYARISRLKVKAGRLDDLLAFRDGRKQELEKLQGLKYMLGLSGQDSEYLVVAIYESETDAQSDRAMNTAGEFWFKIGDLIEGKPDVRSYDVTHFESFSPT